MSLNTYRVPAGTDPYGLGECTCGHLRHNHGFGACFGDITCRCKLFSKGYSPESDKILNDTFELLTELKIRSELNYWNKPKGKSSWQRLIALIKGEQK